MGRSSTLPHFSDGTIDALVRGLLVICVLIGTVSALCCPFMLSRCRRSSAGLRSACLEAFPPWTASGGEALP